ncbi:MAG: DUF3333 domain-containing protein, partial [Desulfobulbaceae bacterium]
MNNTPEKRLTSLSSGKDSGLSKRYRAEQRFKRMGIGAIFIALAFLVFLFTTIIGNGHSAFRQTYVQFEFNLDKQYFTDEDLSRA